MPTTRPDAIEAMLAHFWAFWKTDTVSLNDDPNAGGAPIRVEFDNVEKTDSPGSNFSYAEVSIVHSISPQQTFGEVRRYNSIGQFVVVVRVPTGAGRTLSDAICKVIVDGFRGKNTGPDGVFFRDPKVQEQGRKDGVWWTQNVLVGFDYDEIA